VQTVIVHPGSNIEAVTSPEAQEKISVWSMPEVILPSKTLSSVERLGIYRGMYQARLREALQADYPGLLHFLGEEKFSQLAAGYIQAYPSRSYTLNRLGDFLPEYLQVAAGIPRRKFVCELASFELTLSQLFDAAESPVLTPQDVAGVPLEAWQTARLNPIEAFRLSTFAYPVNAYLRSVREGKPARKIRRKNTWLALFRRHYTTWRLELSRPAFDLLGALTSGQSLGEVVQSFGSGKRARFTEAELFRWLREWVAEGMFQGVDFSG
jgi:hypothetical protein